MIPGPRLFRGLGHVSHSHEGNGSMQLQHANQGVLPKALSGRHPTTAHSGHRALPVLSGPNIRSMIRSG